MPSNSCQHGCVLPVPIAGRQSTSTKDWIEDKHVRTMFDSPLGKLSIFEKEEESRDVPDVDFMELSDDEFWNYIIQENMDSTNLTEEELREKPIWEIEAILDIDLSNVSMPRGNRGGFHVDNDRKEVISPEEKRKRKERVNKELGLE